MANSRRGFTLIELLVVIAIIALLLAIIMPSLRKAREVGKRIVCASGLKQIGIAMKIYADMNDDKLPDNRGERHAYVVYRDGMRDANGILLPIRWAYLYEFRLIEKPEIFYCNSNQSSSKQYRSYISPGAWGTLPQDSNSTNQWVRIGYTYFPVEARSKLGATHALSKINIADTYSNLDLHMPYATDVISSRKGLSHQAHRNIENATNEELELASNNYTINALYVDTSVSSCRDREVFSGDMGDVWWDQENTQGLFDHSPAGYERFYYMVFRAISN